MIPDLWRAQEDAQRLYSLYLHRLRVHDLKERIIAACRRIRQYALRGPGAKEGLFTFYSEIDALCELKRYNAALRQARLRHLLFKSERLDLKNHHWSAGDGHNLAFTYAPLLFFLGRYQQGCKLLETALDFWLKGGSMVSYDICHVLNRDAEPEDRCGVTLSHFYGRLGKDLTEWQHWNAFVDGFPVRLFQLSGVQREELRADSVKLRVFMDRLRGHRIRRTRSGRIWIESDERARKRRESRSQKAAEWKNRPRSRRARIEAKLLELFPELQGLD